MLCAHWITRRTCCLCVKLCANNHATQQKRELDDEDMNIIHKTYFRISWKKLKIVGECWKQLNPSHDGNNTKSVPIYFHFHLFQLFFKEIYKYFLVLQHLCMYDGFVLCFVFVVLVLFFVLVSWSFAHDLEHKQQLPHACSSSRTHFRHFTLQHRCLAVNSRYIHLLLLAILGHAI